MLRGLPHLLWLLTAAPAVVLVDGDPPSARGRAAPAGDTLGAPARTTPAARRPLPFFYDLYTFRGDARHTAVIAAFAVPTGQLEREEEDDEVRYRFDVTLVLADTATRAVYRTDDTVFVSVPRPLDGEHLLATHIEVRAPPSSTTLQRVIMNDETTPGIGQLYTSAFPIPDYRGSRLMLSDIAMGLPDAQAGWIRGDVRLALLPTSQFPEGSFDLYYEVYNLPRGNRYVTEITIEPVDEEGTPQPDAGNAVRTTFTGEAATRGDGSLAELRRVDATLPRGRYRLTVSVTDQETGGVARRSRLFHVQGWMPGTTLVPALPRRSRTATPS
jgi:hypothetical protein